MAGSNVFSTALRRNWWSIILVVVVSVGLAALLTARQTPRYMARSTLVVTPNYDIDDPSDVLRSLENLERRTIVATFARIAATREARSAVEERLGLEEGGLRDYRMSASVVPYTNLIRFEVEGPDTDRAAAAVEALGRHTRTEARSMYRVYTLRAFEEGRAGGTPVHPDWQRNLVVATIVGLFIGLGAALLLARLELPSRAAARRTGVVTEGPPGAGSAPVDASSVGPSTGPSSSVRSFSTRCSVDSSSPSSS